MLQFVEFSEAFSSVFHSFYKKNRFFLSNLLDKKAKAKHFMSL